MVDRLISEYVARMTEQDVDSFAKNNGIFLKPKEVSFIYQQIKQDWRTIVYGNPRGILDDLQTNLEPEVYAKVEQLYVQFKNKYQAYL